MKNIAPPKFVHQTFGKSSDSVIGLPWHWTCNRSWWWVQERESLRFYLCLNPAKKTGLLDSFYWCPVSLHMWREILMITFKVLQGLKICPFFEHNAQNKHLPAIYSPHVCVWFLFLVVHSRPLITDNQLSHTTPSQPTLSHNSLTTNSLTHTTPSHNSLTHNSFTHNFLTHTLTHTTYSHTASSHTHTHNLLTHNSLTYNLLTHNLLTRNSLTHNSFTHNSLTYSLTHNLLTHNSLTHTQLSHNSLTHNSLTHASLTHATYSHLIRHIFANSDVECIVRANTLQ